MAVESFSSSMKEMSKDAIKDFSKSGKAALDFMGILKSMGKIGVSGLLGGIAGFGISLLEEVIVTGIKLQQLQREQREEAVKQHQANAAGYLEQADYIRALAKEYEELSHKEWTWSENERFLSMEKALASALGITTQAVNSQAKSLVGLSGMTINATSMKSPSKRNSPCWKKSA